jgi:hypothetical protein
MHVTVLNRSIAALNATNDLVHTNGWVDDGGEET